MSHVLPAIPGLLFVALGYAAVCAVSPFGLCRKCRGFGREIRRSRITGRLSAGRECRRCDGHGRRIRIGRWIYNRIARLHDDGTR